MWDDERIATWAAANHSLLELNALFEMGATRRELDRRMDAGLLVPVHAGVCRFAAVPVTWPQQLHAACLAAGPGAAVSHRAGVTWWGLDGAIPGVVEIAVPRPQWPRLAGVRKVHRSTDLCDDHVVVRDGIRITTPVRTLVDYGAVAPAWKVDRAYGHALGKKLVTRRAVELLLDDVGRKGRRGVGVMREVLAERGVDGNVDGWLAARGADVLRRHGIAMGIAEYEIYEGKRFVARVDRAWPEIKFCVEWDGDERHLGSTADDVERQNAIQEAGWDFRRFGRRHVVHEEAYVAATIRRAIAVRQLLVTESHRYGEFR